MATLSPTVHSAVAPSPYNGPASSDLNMEALRVPTIVFLTLAVSVIIISILLVWRHLYRTWRGITPDDAGTVDSVTAQQDKELTLMESQLHRSTPIVVLQPDSRVMCAHKDSSFAEAAKLQAQHPDGDDRPVLALDITATTPRAPTGFLLITDLSAHPADSAAMPRSISPGRHSLAGLQSGQGLHEGIPSYPGHLLQNLGEAGSSSDLQSQGSHAEHGPHEDGAFHFRQPSTGQGQPGFSDRHRNSSAVSLSSLAGSDVSTCSTTYVTELPEGSSLFYEGPCEHEP